MPPQIDRHLVEGLLESDTGTIGHILDAGFMEPAISARMPGRKIAGTAVTVRVTVPDSVISHYVLKFVRPGDVVIIDRGQDQQTACWGAISAAAAATRGVAGLIVDGAGNDISQSASAGLAIWCRSISPITTKYRDLGGEINVPISCGGVAIMPGDAILADENGVVVIPRQDVEEVVVRSRQFLEFERETLARIRADKDFCLPDDTGASAFVEQEDGAAGKPPRLPGQGLGAMAASPS